jgi:hypothetical protein
LIGQELASGTDGNTIYISSSSGGVWKIEAEPCSPGITGSPSFVSETSRLPDGRFATNLRGYPTPGAVEAKEALLKGIFNDGARAIGELLNLEPSATLQVRDFVQSPATLQEALDIIDGDGDGNVNLTEALDWPEEYAQRFDGIDPAIEEPVSRFLTSVRQRMKLDTMNEEMSRQITVDAAVFRSSEIGPTLFDVEGLCSLLKLYIADGSVADQLCQTLRQAAHSRGDLRTRDTLLAAYFRELASQVHRTLTRRNATTMVYLTVGFFEVVHDTTLQR